MSTIEQIEQKIDRKHPGLLEKVTLNMAELLFANQKSHGEEGEDGSIYVSQVEMLNACNHAMAGSFWAGGVEYTFEAEMGDRNGFMWRFLSDTAPIPEIEPPKQDRWDLQPKRHLISQAIAAKKGPFLVLKWDAIRSRAPYTDLPQKYAYDKFFCPGSKTESYWRGKAAEGMFDIVTKEEAAETRKRLMEATS